MGLANQRAAYAKGLKSESVTFEGVTLVRETEKAILVTFPEEGELWIPLSQVHKLERSKVKGGDKITVSQWIAEQKGLV